MKWQEIISDKLIDENARDAILQQFIQEENYSQKGAPLLVICERFTPDGPLHGKCSATLALFLTIVEFANSNQGIWEKDVTRDGGADEKSFWIALFCKDD